MTRYTSCGWFLHICCAVSDHLKSDPASLPPCLHPSRRPEFHCDADPQFLDFSFKHSYEFIETLSPISHTYKKNSTPTLTATHPTSPSLLVTSHKIIASVATSITRITLFSFPTFVLCKHEGQNDVVQHVHPRWLDLESCLLSLRNVVGAVEFSNYCLLFVGGDQLRDKVQYRKRWRGEQYYSPWGSSVRMRPLPIDTECRPAQ